MVSDIQWSVSKWYYQYNGWTKKYIYHKAASFWCQLFLKKKKYWFQGRIRERGIPVRLRRHGLGQEEHQEQEEGLGSNPSLSFNFIL